MKQINWGIIGCGTVTEKKSGPAFNKIEGSRLVAVMRRDAEKAAGYARRHQVPRWYDKADDLIHDTDVNAVYIATPPHMHASYAIKAMRAGKPVYVEKPMARTYAECLEMNRVSEETGVPLFVAYYRRRLPGFLKLKEWIDKGKIGRVDSVSVRLMLPPRKEDHNRKNLPWRVIPEIAGGGYFYDLASHQFDILDYIFGPVKEIQAVVTNRGGLYEAEDTLAVNFGFASGVTGQGNWSFVANPVSQTDTIEVFGSEGHIRFSTFQVVPLTLVTGSGETEFTFQNPENIQFNLIKTVVGAIQGKGECPSTGLTAARTNRVLEEVVKDYYKQRSGR
ncbi:MAG: Gfo/Idh/MocA family oxidoreductase [Chlorobi bacterium]|nr:Gfo/Idh/MocA family oxidoreductase [Chlorobiota bacterium]